MRAFHCDMCGRLLHLDGPFSEGVFQPTLRFLWHRAEGLETRVCLACMQPIIEGRAEPRPETPGITLTPTRAGQHDIPLPRDLRLPLNDALLRLEETRRRHDRRRPYAEEWTSDWTRFRVVPLVRVEAAISERPGFVVFANSRTTGKVGLVAATDDVISGAIAQSTEPDHFWQNFVEGISGPQARVLLNGATDHGPRLLKGLQWPLATVFSDPAVSEDEARFLWGHLLCELWSGVMKLHFAGTPGCMRSIRPHPIGTAGVALLTRGLTQQPFYPSGARRGEASFEQDLRDLAALGGAMARDVSAIIAAF